MDSKEAREDAYCTAVSSRTDVTDVTDISEKKLLPSFSIKDERRLVRKFDLLIMPPLMLMFLFTEFDLGNVGNAKTGGWDKDIGLTGNQYYILVMVFFVPFTVFGTPIALLAKYFSAARVLPIMMLGFGILSILTASAKNFSQVFAIRFFLGTFQSAVLPGTIYYLSTFYRRNELGLRIALFFAAGALALAFSGLVAFGVFHIEHSKYHGWQFLFWIQGGCTLLAGVFAYLILPRSPSTWSRLTEEEKAIAKARILADASSSPVEKLNIRDAFQPFKEPLYWIWALISLALGVPLSSVGVFLPQIVFGLGYSPIKTNLFVVAPSLVGIVILLAFTLSSDRFRERSIHTCGGIIIGFVGFIILICIDPLKKGGVAYFACFLLTAGAFVPAVLVNTWFTNNTLDDTRRAVVSAILVGLSNSAGLISTNIFRAQDEPKYVPALATCAAFEGLSLVLVAGVGLYMRIENKRRNREQQVNKTAADVPTDELALGPKSPSFRYMA